MNEETDKTEKPQASEEAEKKPTEEKPAEKPAADYTPKKEGADSIIQQVKTERIALEKVRDSVKAENDRAEKIIVESHLDGKGFAGLEPEKKEIDKKAYGKSIMAGKIPEREDDDDKK